LHVFLILSLLEYRFIPVKIRRIQMLAEIEDIINVVANSQIDFPKKICVVCISVKIGSETRIKYITLIFLRE